MKSFTFLSKPFLSTEYCSAATVFRGSSKSQRSVKSELRPHTTSLRVRVGNQPLPSSECSRRILKQIFPSSVIFGCHNLVLQCALGGLMLYSTGMQMVNTNCPPFQYPSSGFTVSVNSRRSSTSSKSILQDFGRHDSISDTSLVNNRLLMLICLPKEGLVSASSFLFCCSLNIFFNQVRTENVPPCCS